MVGKPEVGGAQRPVSSHPDKLDLEADGNRCQIRLKAPNKVGRYYVREPDRQIQRPSVLSLAATESASILIRQRQQFPAVFEISAATN